MSQPNDSLPKKNRTPGDVNGLTVMVQAGKMELKDGIVHPLLERGYLSIVREPVREKLELTWFSKDGTEVNPYLLKPGMVTVDWVEKCDTGRVMLFNIENGKTLLFFWLQSKSTENDDALMKEMKYLLEKDTLRPPTSEAEGFIQMPTMRRILAEVSPEVFTNDVDLVEILTSRKLVEELEKNKEFYATRMRNSLMARELESDNLLDPLAFIRDSHVQWIAVILGILLRHENTHAIFSSCFAGDSESSDASVMNFLMNINKLCSRRNGE
ncbi:Proteasomal ubiquitin receptor Rpn13/ADRM1 [Trypanosoma melophagium]|uniref:Proteasomal ubiquitin receptor Rpn13/ADRM1 n=1 Tax=Trypanosoma melophagium TaxID=715481 RepID=UPI003519F2DD|nr:Proteasomal ubiquitin receptor Rpn13/ADRM1 [Trypanosoma melophagium]